MIVISRTMYFCFALLFVIQTNISSQSRSVDKQLWADSLLNFIYEDQQMDSKSLSDLADSVYRIFVRENDICKQIKARVKQATFLDNIGLADSALIQLYWVNKSYNSGCDSMLLFSLYRNLTNVYLSLNELERIDSISQLALSLWNPAWKDKETRFAILNNLAIAHAYRQDIPLATSTFRQVLREAEAINHVKYIQNALNNLGSIKGRTGDLDSAYYYFNTAAELSKKNKDMDGYMSLLINLAKLGIDMGRYDRAIIQLDSAYQLADTLKNTDYMARIQRVRAELFYKKRDYKSAYGFLDDYVELRQQNLNKERVKAVTEMMEKYESEKKARLIQQLELDNLDATLQNERITHTRNRYLYIGIFILLTAIGIWTRLQYVHKSRAAIQKEKDISEGLLLNILPASVAEELKIKGHADAKHFNLATILFSDFKEFTAIAEGLSPTALVEEINFCFKAFDEIITRYGIEKIKTIGDAYMAAGAIPEKNKATAYEVVLAALEMQQVIINRKKERDALQLPAFEMRVGIHSGPVVAGIVGVKKFQYDLWGDTVNTASRMESSGVIQKVNISEVTYNLIKDHPTLVFTPRGKVHAKGKGEMPMYFVALADLI